jgi:hypothetical protein
MRVVKKFLIWLGITVAIVLLTTITIILTNWPLWVAILVFLVYLCIALLLTHFVRKKIYQYRTGFIDENEKIDSLEHSSYSRLKSIEQKLRQEQRQNLLNEIHRLPWILNLSLDDDEFYQACTKQAIISTVTTDEIDTGARWSVLENMLVLCPEQTVYENIDNPYWADFLHSMLKHHSGQPFNKIVISISVKQLMGELAIATLDKLNLLRSRIQQIFQITGYSIPINIIITHLQELTTFSNFQQNISMSEKQQPLGIYATSVEETEVQDLFDNFLIQFNNYIDIKSYQDKEISTDAYYSFCDELANLRENCKKVYDLICKNSNAFKTNLSGLFFIAQTTDGGFFSRDLVLDIISKQNIALQQTSTGLSRIYFKRNLYLGSYYIVAAIIIIYIIVAFSTTITNLKSLLRSIPQKVVYGDNLEKNLKTIYNYDSLMRNIIDFKNRWTIKAVPFYIGIDRIERYYSKDYVTQFRANILNLFINYLQAYLNQHNGKLTPLEHAYIVENIVESINIIQAKLDDQSFDYIQSLDAPEIRSIGLNDMQSTIIDGYGALFKLYVWNENDKAQLRNEQGQFIKFLNNYNLLTKDQNMHWLVSWANTQSDIKPVTLHDYWHGAITDNKVKVSPAYTEEGNTRLNHLLMEINQAVPAYIDLTDQESNFREWYNQQRLDAWHNFALHFHEGLDTLDYKTQWQAFFSNTNMLSNQGPYYQLLDTLFNQLSTINVKYKPDWLIQIEKFYGLLDFQVKKNAIDKTQNIATVTRSFLEGITLKPSVIHQRGRLDSLFHQDFDNDLDAAQAFLEYQVQLNKLYSTSAASAGEAFDTSSALYSVNARGASKSAVAINNAYSSYMKMFSLLGNGSANDTVFWLLLRGPLDFYIDYTNRQASCYAQTQWVANVVKSTNGLSGQELTNMLFGQKGLAWNFMNKYLQPFLQINENVFVPKLVYGHIFPFTDEFYGFINHGLTIQSVNREQKQFENYFNQNGGRLLTITSSPTGTNSDAQELPYKVSIRTICNNQPFVFDGYNFTASTQMQWKLGQCGPASLNIYFKTYTLTKSYPGQFGFAHFLRDYLNGEVIYTPKDFPDATHFLQSYNIKNIRVHFQVQGLSDIDYKLDNFFLLNDRLLESEQKYLVDGNLPNNITLCWKNGLNEKIYKAENAYINRLINSPNKTN